MNIPSHYIKIGDEYFAPSSKQGKAHTSKDGFRSLVVKTIPLSWPTVKPELADRVRPTPEEALNKTERRYLNLLRERFPFQPIMIQAITLRLAHNTKYTPDFSYTLPTGALVFVETKGAFVRDDAIVKLKTAAAMFPQFTFIKAQFKLGKWKETLVPK